MVIKNFRGRIGGAARRDLPLPDGPAEPERMVFVIVAPVTHRTVRQDLQVGADHVLQVVGQDIERGAAACERRDASRPFVALAIDPIDDHGQEAEDRHQQHAGDQEFEEGKAPFHGRPPGSPKWV